MVGELEIDQSGEGSGLAEFGRLDCVVEQAVGMIERDIGMGGEQTHELDPRVVVPAGQVSMALIARGKSRGTRRPSR